MNVPARTSGVTAASPSAAEQERERLGSIALDQWRGLALVLVLISHGFYFTSRVHGIGRVGVNLFFFISGILVFRSLSRTRAATDRERAQSFWWRRFRRLYPALSSYTLAMLGGTWLLQHRPGLPLYSDPGSYLNSMPLALGCVINYFTGTSPFALRHLWSIACEMQFYFVAPLIYWLGGRSDKRRRIVFGFVLAVLVLLGIAQPFIGRWHPNYWQYNFEFTVWPMMLGFCCEYERDWFRKMSERLVTFVLWCSIAIGAGVLALTVFGLEMKILVVAIGALLLIPCLLAYLSGRPLTGVPGRCFKWVGERTYSIYLWQQPFTICDFLPPHLRPFGALASMVPGAIWFHFFERPFLSASRRKNGPAADGVMSRPPKIIAATVVVLLFTSTSVFAVVRAHYADRLREQLWPHTAPPVSVRADPLTAGNPTVLLLGDSRITEWDLPHLGNRRVVNAGMSGFTTGQIRLRAADLLEVYHPATVVLQAGINDLKYLGLQPDETAAVVSLASSNMAAIVAECVRRHSQVLVLETWPAGAPSPARRLVWSEQIGAGLESLNAELRKLDSPDNGIRVVDLFRLAGLKSGPDEYRDTLHFKPEVYEQLTPVLEKQLTTLSP
jgi:peptidoglycan/LPS O-acetylase OafA/YrhL/lysophospholipase L1-like esterase